MKTKVAAQRRAERKPYGSLKKGKKALPLNCIASALALCAGPVFAQAAPPAEAEVTLPTVTVKDTRDTEDPRYQADKTRVGKVPQLTKDIPQSVTIVTEQLMKDRNADTFKEALRNVAGLTFNAGEGGRIGDNITLRGYSAVGDLFLDGIRDIAQYNRETFNLQQIDVLRGSASMLFGRGSTGGIINQVSKTAKPVDRNEVDMTFGTDDYKRVTADINKVLSEDLSLRINAMNTDAGSFRDGVRQNRWGLAPSLTWGSGTADEVTLAYYYLKENNVPDLGVPWNNYTGRPVDVPISRFYGMSNADYEHNSAGIATAAYTHQFNNDSSIRTIVRRADYQRDMRAVAPRITPNLTTVNSITDSSVVNRQRQARGAYEHTLDGQVDYNTRFIAMGMKHQVLGGMEYLEERANRWTNTSALANPSTTVDSSDTNPALPANFDASFSRTNPNSYKAHTVSAYGQDTVEFVRNWSILAGARFDSMKADYVRTAPLGPLSRNDNVWSWRTGLLYQPTKLSTYYVSYGTSFNPSAELYQLDDRTANTPPEKSRNYEAGAKWELMNGDLSLRTAIFRSEKTNERNTDLSSPDIFLLSAKRHTDGIELEAVGRIDPKWDVFGNVAFMRANVDEGGRNNGTFGKTPINTPNRTFSVWTTYKLALGWRVGGGVEGVGARWADAANTRLAPSYTRVDALVEYEAKKYFVKLNVFNLFNTKYYEGVYQGNVTPGTPLAAQVTLGLKF